MTNELKLHVLRTGTLMGDLGWLISKPGLTLMDRNNKDAPRRWVDYPIHSVLIEHPEGRLLWDTGVPRDWETRWAPTGFQEMWPVKEDIHADDGWLDSGLSQLELTPQDIDILVCSHLHFDHIGNIREFDNGKTRLIAHNDEIAGVRALEGPVNGCHIESDYAGLNLEGTAGDIEILPGVTLINTPGHTWGTMSLKVDLPNDGTKIFTSDAVYLKDSFGPPVNRSPIVWDSRQYLESVEKIRSIADKSSAQVIFGHDEEQIKELRTAPNNYYT